ncbi:MAG: LysM peptidoglycan-binding domain-containing protein [Verrucomicrobia bacterium]|nr:LysM peptidoglycan-binding domain-containing protein [Verrucomicrobiota bacterium]
MNSQNPPNLPLSPLSQPSSGKSNVRIAVLTIIAVHAVFFGGLLLQGCKKRTADAATDGNLASAPAGRPSTDLGPLTNPPYADVVHALTSNTVAAAAPSYVAPAAGLSSTPNLGLGAAPYSAPDLTHSTAAAAAAATTTEYEVKKGDYPAKIARAHGVTVAALMQANPGVVATRLQIGQKLVIPPPAAAVAVAEPAVEPGVVMHVVTSGENLTRIAQRYGTTVPELRAANDLKTDRITVGQKLKVPGAKASAEGTRPTSGLLPSTTVASNRSALR